MMLKKYIPDVLLILIAIIWALNFSVVKVSLQEIDSLSFNALRYILAAGLLAYTARARGYSLKVDREDFWPLVGIALVGNVLYQLFFIIGVDYTYSANAAVILGTIPVWVALLSHLFTDEKLTRYKSIGIGLAFTGIVLIVTGSKAGISIASKTFLGDVIILCAAISWGVYTILAKRFLKKYPSTQFTGVMSIVGMVFLLIIGLPNLLHVNWTGISLKGWGGIFYSGLLSIGLAYLIWNNSVSKIGAVRTAAYQNLVPVLGLVFGVVLLQEALTLQQYSGSALVIVGIIFSRF
ncbi:MAG: DMT family transporter [Bacteroidetes bacterium]|jgi:drug/metabolite transporter (DMT)-like permease|nr:DMT family transporter [Bacteroidota bacterium]|tara:strand:- start:4629 stop:5507 length:879 start_codon:yes stop_codon:yes gene_type:complete